MSAIAFELPQEVREACDGLVAFARSEVMPRHEKHRALLEDPRRLYREDGRWSDQAIALIREVRRAAAKAGSYSMRVPQALGGGGLGHLAYYAGWEQTVPSMWSAELANALRNQSLGIRSEPAA